MLTSNIQLGYVLTRGGGQAAQGGLSCPPPRISERMDKSANFITPSTTGIFSWKWHKLHWDANFKRLVGLRIDKGWGQAVQDGLSCPPPRISERMDNPQILLHHLLQEYLVERNINFTEMFTSNVQLVAYWQGVQFGYVLTRGGGQAVQCSLSCPPPRISQRMDNLPILLHHLLQEYLVERDINFISVNLRCLLQMFSWVTYWQEWGPSCPGRFILPPAQNFYKPAWTVCPPPYPSDKDNRTDR